jgi:hypothetical protein
MCGMTTTRPAVRFDPDGLRAWLTADCEPGCNWTRAEDLGVDGEWFGSVNSGESPVARIEQLVAELCGHGELSAEGTDFWQLADDVKDVAIFRTADGDGVDGGGLICVDLVNEVRLASLHQDGSDFDGCGPTGVDAAVAGVQYVAWKANELVDRYRKAQQESRPR